jgi:DNA-binding LacI/PurR family transcriptional regulator
LKRLPRVVSILGNPAISGGYTVESDVADGVRQSVEHLHAQGRKRIVQLLEGTEAQMDRQRLEAFLAAHREFYGSEPDEAQVCFASAGWVVEDYDKYAELARELAVDRRADAILAESDFSAPGIVRGLMKAGKRIPDDVALVGWGYEILGRGLTPSLTTIDFDFNQIIGRALELLNDMIERPNEPQERSIFIKPKLILRETA